ncbi:hypothetical protein ANCCAN_26835 [Ancylostoma caninum]|uniref:ZP domain-containing protein n=1 Tax=Ancylostoma caninum TaxID=29170 RepID=A0A368F5M5_ANCCA|nr:hypothetical protein ANCCAN_26835 [Ancylostoma caninum]
MCFRLAVFALFVTVSAWGVTSPPVLDNGVASLPEVNCMEDRVRLTFKTQRPFQGRIFVKGMVDKDQCVNSYLSNTNTEVSFDLENGACNMRRTRMVSARDPSEDKYYVHFLDFEERISPQLLEWFGKCQKKTFI